MSVPTLQALPYQFVRTESKNELCAYELDLSLLIRSGPGGKSTCFDVVSHGVRLNIVRSKELPIEAFVATMNTNYLGAVRCIKAVLPSMRQARTGCIINVSSVAGRIASSPLGPYGASKFALEAITEALAGEVKAFNIRVAIVGPGIQDTKLARAIENPPPSAYPQVARFAGLFKAALEHPVSPAVTAAIIRHIIESGMWQLRHPSGPDAAAFINWRAAMSDEQWVQWSAQGDEAWYEQVQRDFGLNARGDKRAAPAGVR